VTHRVEVHPRVRVTLQQAHGEAAVLGQQPRQRGGQVDEAVGRVALRRVQLGAVTGGEQRQLGDAERCHAPGERGEQFVARGGAERELFAHGERRGVMSDSQADDRHPAIPPVRRATGAPVTGRNVGGVPCHLYSELYGANSAESRRRNPATHARRGVS
jgi:hypothetical protein